MIVSNVGNASFYLYLPYIALMFLVLGNRMRPSSIKPGNDERTAGKLDDDAVLDAM